MAIINPNLLNPNTASDVSPTGPAKKAGRFWKRLIIFALIIIFLIIVLFAVILFSNIKDVNYQDRTIDNSALQNLAINDNARSPERLLAEKVGRPHWGNPEAKLVIVEFSDFQCPYCNQEFPIIREFTSKYQNDLYYIYRQFPIINENSLIFSEASLCAEEQGKFWQFHDRLFSAPEKDVNDIENIALLSGVDINKFKTCLTTQKYRAQTIEDYQDGVALGAVGTPTFFVNGNILPGVVSLEQWEQILKKWNEIYPNTNN